MRTLLEIGMAIGRDGAIVGRFGSRTKPDDKELVEAVEQALKTPK